MVNYLAYSSTCIAARHTIVRFVRANPNYFESHNVTIENLLEIAKINCDNIEFKCRLGSLTLWCFLEHYFIEGTFDETVEISSEIKRQFVESYIVNVISNGWYCGINLNNLFSMCVITDEVELCEMIELHLKKSDIIRILQNSAYSGINVIQWATTRYGEQLTFKTYNVGGGIFHSLPIDALSLVSVDVTSDAVCLLMKYGAFDKVEDYTKYLFKQQYDIDITSEFPSVLNRTILENIQTICDEIKEMRKINN